MNRRIELLRILAHHDPIGICQPGNSGGVEEYAPEARTILPRLVEGTTLDGVRIVLTEEFDHWFGPGSLEKSGKLLVVAGEVFSKIVNRR